LKEEVAIVSVGCVGFQPVTPELSYKEIMFEAAVRAYEGIVNFAFDPIFNRPLGGHPYYVAGVEMMRYLYETGTKREQCAQVAVKNKRNALLNPHACYGAKITVEDVLNSETQFYPLKKLEISQLSDGCVVFLAASAEMAKKLTDRPVWIRGVGWCTETPCLETRDWGKSGSRRACG